MAKDVFDSSTAIEMRDALNGVLLNSSRFNWKLYESIRRGLFSLLEYTLQRR